MVLLLLLALLFSAVIERQSAREVPHRNSELTTDVRACGPDADDQPVPPDHGRAVPVVSAPGLDVRFTPQFRRTQRIMDFLRKLRQKRQHATCAPRQADHAENIDWPAAEIARITPARRCDSDPTTWTVIQQDGPKSPRIVANCAPRASNSPNHLGLCALRRAGSVTFDHGEPMTFEFEGYKQSKPSLRKVRTPIFNRTKEMTCRCTSQVDHLFSAVGSAWRSSPSPPSERTGLSLIIRCPSTASP